MLADSPTSARHRENLMDKTDALKERFDAFSRHLAAKIREFQTTGELSAESEAERIRKSHEAMTAKLDSAIGAGEIPDILRLEFERDFDGLLHDFRRVEREFHAAGAKGYGEEDR
jgi:hypothetical protein